MISNNTYEEVYKVLSYMDKITVMKIPNSILKKIKDNRNVDYKTKINKNDIFNEQNLSKEAVDLLCWLDYKYLMDNERKYSIDKKIKEINSEQEKKREQYNASDLFKKVENEKTVESSINTSLAEYKEPFLAKLKKFIFKILHINN